MRVELGGGDGGGGDGGGRGIRGTPEMNFVACIVK